MLHLFKKTLINNLMNKLEKIRKIVNDLFGE
jgi:hypothetical protein